MNTLPDPTVPSSGTTAAPAPGATGGAEAESTPAAKSAASQRSDAEIMAAFLGEPAEGSSQAPTPPPEGEGTDSPGAPEAGAQGADDTAPDGKTTTDDDNPNANATDERGKLDHLIQAVAKDPQNVDSPAYKRLTKILGENPKLKQQITDLTAKLKDSKGPPIVTREATPDDPLSHIATKEELTRAIKQARATKANAQAWLNWIEDHPEGGTPPGAKEELDAEAVKAKRAEARGYLNLAESMLESSPAKEKYLSQLEEVRESLRKSRPELFEENSPELAEATALISSGRVGSDHPEYMLDALDLIEGRRARQKREKGIQSIDVDPKAAATKAAEAGKNGSGSSQTQRPGPQGAPGGTRTPPPKPAGAGADVDGLRKRIAAGDKKAGDELARQFLAA